MRARRIITSLIFVLAVCALPAAALGFNNQTTSSDNISGKYEGTSKSQAFGEFPLTVQIKQEAGKITGSIDTPQGSLPITSGTYADGKVVLKFDAGGNEGTVNAQLKDGKITGEWSVAGQTGTMELKAAGATPATPPASSTPAATAAAGDPVTGEWSASADVQGSSLPFTLKLKLDGDKVTGESSSEQGTMPLSKGTYSAGKLTVVLETPNGNVTLSGMIADGKLTGEYDFAGQMTGKWEAKKK
jgi:hypothetical protein